MSKAGCAGRRPFFLAAGEDRSSSSPFFAKSKFEIPKRGPSIQGGARRHPFFFLAAGADQNFIISSKVKVNQATEHGAKQVAQF